MQVEVNEIDYCKVHVTYNVDGEQVKLFRDKVVSEMTKTYSVPGYRNGKATPEAIKFSYPKEVETLLKESLARQAFTDVLAEKGLKPFGNPQFTSISLLNDLFKCEFNLHTLPKVELKKYKEFDLPKFNSPSTSEELAQQILQKMRETHGETVPFTNEDKIQLNDQVILNCEASLNGQKYEPFSFSGTMLQVGRISIPGFDDQIIGMKLDEERTFSLVFPVDYQNKELAGQEMSFTVKLMMGSKVNPAPLDDSLAKKCALEDFSKLLEEINLAASSRVKEWETNYLHDQIAKRLLENHQDIQVPNWISLPEAKLQAKNVGLEWDKISEDEKNKYILQAEQAIKLSLILSKVQEEMIESQLTDEELVNLARLNLARATPNPEKIMEELYKTGKLGVFLGRIKDEYALDAIVKTCNIID